MCGLLYCLGDADDEKAHDAHCDPFRKGVSLSSPWRTERVVPEAGRLAAGLSAQSSGSGADCSVGDGSRVVEVRAGDLPHKLAKAAEVHAIVAAELGCSLELAAAHARTYLLVHDRRVVACLVAEHVTVAFRLCPVLLAAEAPLAVEAATPTPTTTVAAVTTTTTVATPPTAAAAATTPTTSHAKSPEDSSGAGPDCPVDVSVSALPRPSEPAAATPAAAARRAIVASAISAPGPALEVAALPTVGSWLGVRAVWVHASWRRRGVASRLLDAARHTLLFAAALPRSACAFTALTDDGRAFAVRYCGMPSLLLFHP
jgi:hypothetical protein